MKRYKNLLIMLIFLGNFLLPASTGMAQTPSTSVEEPYQGDALCLPGVYLQNSNSCAVQGPAKYLSDLAAQGIFVPALPLPISSPSIDLATIPFRYAKVINSPAGVYSSLAEADGRLATFFLTGKTMYISYKNTSETEKGFYYVMSSGMLIDGGDVARAAPPAFQGFLVHRTPSIAFGWILTPTKTRPDAGFEFEESKHEFNRFDLVQVYDMKEVRGENWLKISANEWIEDRVTSRVTPNTTPPDGVDGGRWIEVNLEEQTLLVYDQYQMVFATMISSGIKPFYTRPGLFQIVRKLPKDTMSGSFEQGKTDYYYLEDVPWTMYFDGLRALHGAYWHTLFGYEISHGCVNMSIGDARWLYEWSKEGDWVYVWDPSGETPTDPSYYTQGGA